MDKSTLITCSTMPAKIGAIAKHLAVSSPVAREVVVRWNVKICPGDHYDLIDMWHRLWGIRSVPRSSIEAMMTPLLSVDELAEIANVSAKTIRRAGDSGDPKWNLPRHIDLGSRTRRYLPLHVEAWFRRQPLDLWLQPQLGPAKTVLGLRLKAAANLPPTEKLRGSGQM